MSPHLCAELCSDTMETDHGATTSQIPALTCDDSVRGYPLAHLQA